MYPHLGISLLLDLKIKRVFSFTIETNKIRSVSVKLNLVDGGENYQNKLPFLHPLALNSLMAFLEIDQ